MIGWIQRATFEAPIMQLFAPGFGAVAAGYAVLVGFDLYLTPSGEHYLSKIEQPNEGAA